MGEVFADICSILMLNICSMKHVMTMQTIIYADEDYENDNLKDAESGALMLRAAPFMPENCLEVSLSTFESLFKS